MPISIDSPATSDAALQDAHARIADLEATLHRSRTMGMALGIIVERGKITTDDAMDLLRRLSTEQGRSVDDVAAGIVAGHIACTAS